MPLTRQALLFAAAAAVFGPVAVGPALAVDRTWDGFSSNQFTAPINWTTSVAPTASDKAIFSNQAGVTRSLVVLNADTTVSGVDIQAVPAIGAYEFQKQNNASLTISNSLIVAIPATATLNGFRTKANAAFVFGTLNLTGGAELTTTGDLVAQETGVMNIGTATTSSQSFYAYDGSVFNVNNGGSVNVGTGAFGINNATGQININSGGAVVYNGFSNLFGGTLSLNGTGTLNIGASQLDTDGPARINFNRSFSLPAGKTINIKQGGDLVSTEYVDIAASGAGTFLVDGAGSSVNVGTNPTAIYSYWGLSNAATIAFSNSGTGDFNRGLIVGAGTGANVRVNVTSGASLNIDTSLTTGGAGGTPLFTINSATLSSTGPSAFGSGTTIDLQSGTLILGGDATFSTGSTLNWFGGTLNVASGKTLNVAGGTVNNTSGGIALSPGARLSITNGGRFLNSSYFDIANGTLLVDGAGSRITAGGFSGSDWGPSAGNVATVTFANSGAGTVNILRLAANGGTARLTLSSAGQLNVASLSTGSTSAGGVASITINGGQLSTGTALFQNGTAIALSAGTLAFGGNSTFSTGATLNHTGGTFIPPPSAILSIEGGSVSLAAVTIDNQTDVRLTTGTLNLAGDATFTNGATLSRSGGALNVASGKVLTFSTGGGTFGVSAVVNNYSMRVTNFGLFATSSYLDVASGSSAAGTLSVDGIGSRFIAYDSTAPYIDWGLSPGNVATITFSNSAAGSLSAGVVVGGSGGAALVNVQSLAQLNTASIIIGNSGASSDGVQFNVAGGTLYVVGPATLRTGAVVNYSAGSIGVGGALSLGGDAKILFTNGGGKLLRVGSPASGGTLTLSGTSKIDLADGGLIVDYSGASPLFTFGSYLATGRDGGAWTGNGLTSSTAAAVAANNANPNKTGIGYLDDPALTTLFVAYTYLGDTNLDKTVDTRDFAALVAGFGLGNRQWYQGDFNYSGTVNSTDFTLLVSNYGRTLPSTGEVPILPGALVPEPSVLAALVVAGLLGRRRRVDR